MSTSYSPNIVTNGLVLYLDAANNKSIVSGSNTWRDIVSGGSISGSLVNGPTYNSERKGSIAFDGSNDYALINCSNFQSGNNPLSMEAFFKLNNTPLWNIIFAYGPDGTVRQSPILYIDGSVKAAFEFGSSNGKVVSSVIQTNQWYHVVGTYDNFFTRIYLNGNLQNSTSFSSANVALNNLVNGENAGIGCFFSGQGNVSSPQRYGSFNGNISIIRHYNRALSSQEVLQNYNSTKGRYGL